MRVDEQKLNEASRRDEQALHCEVHIHQEPRRRLSDCAWKAAGITPGDLFCCRGNATEGVERQPDRRAKAKRTEVSRGRSSRASGEGPNELER